MSLRAARGWPRGAEHGTMREMRTPLIAALAISMLALLGAACGGGTSAQDAAVTIEPLPSATATTGIPLGGKPAPPVAVSPTALEPAPTDEAGTEIPAADPTTAPEDPTAIPPTPAATAAASDGSSAPTEGRWIEVDVTNYVVRLMDGQTVVEEVGPVGVGVAIDTGDYVSTQTGLFFVHNMIEGLAYDAPYDTYISHWIGFDPAKDNGFHSLLKDADGNVVDASTGRVSNGCIRTPNVERVFAYAEIGMPVWVHW